MLLVLLPRDRVRTALPGTRGPWLLRASDALSRGSSAPTQQTRPDPAERSGLLRCGAMRGLYLDAFSGLSGDMMLGALVGLGVPLEVLERELARLELPGLSLRRRSVVKHGISATKVDVLVAGRIAEAPGNDTHHGHGHGHAPAPDGGEVPPGTHHHRHWADIDHLLATSSLAPAVRARARRIFRKLAEAEAAVHATSLDAVALHEVGALDAIADITGTAIALEHLGIEQIWVGPIPLGTGFVRTAHGRLPVPAPATVELLRGFAVRPGDGEGEMVTPTGAAIVAAEARSDAPPAFRPLGVAYGAGTRELTDRPNTLRALLIEVDRPGARDLDDVSARLESAIHATASSMSPGSVALDTLPLSPVREEAVMIEASIDDLEPELFGDAVEALREAGALDVTLGPLIMKQGRPGTLVQAIARPENAGSIADVLLCTTTTIGVRLHPVTRVVLPRAIRTVETSFGSVRVKVVTLPDGRVRMKPEHADCARLARAAGVTVAEVRASALRSPTPQQEEENT